MLKCPQCGKERRRKKHDRAYCRCNRPLWMSNVEYELERIRLGSYAQAAIHEGMALWKYLKGEKAA